MQRELRQVLRDQGHQAGVMWTRRDFAEPDLITLDEQLDAKQTTATQGLGHGACNPLGLSQSNRAHDLRLPGFLIVALLLTMPDRRTEGSAANMAHGQQGDFVIEIDEPLDDYTTLTGTAAFLRVIPGTLHVVSAFEQALAFTR